MTLSRYGSVTARMKCEVVTEYVPYGDSVQFDVKLSAVTNAKPEDNSYSKYTPTGTFEITVTNPDLEGYFRPGRAYDLQITEHHYLED